MFRFCFYSFCQDTADNPTADNPTADNLNNFRMVRAKARRGLEKPKSSHGKILSLVLTVVLQLRRHGIWFERSAEEEPRQLSITSY
jgi:hypothetical protein